VILSGLPAGLIRLMAGWGRPKKKSLGQ